VNALATRGDRVSADVVLGEAAAAVAVVTAIAGFTPQGRAVIRKRRRRNQDLDGVPPRVEVVDGTPVVVDKGRAPLAASVAQLIDKVDQIHQATLELTRNGGGTVADAVHRMELKLDEKHAENRHDIAELQETAQGNADALREVATLAGRAATAAASADQRSREHDAESEVFRNVVQQDVAHIWRVLKGMGYDRREGSEG
jgi:hypothetical protein